MNQYRYLLLLPLLLLSLILFSGCSDSGRPTDLPPLFSCTVAVTQGGAALEGAYVELVSPEAQKYRPSATTDASGNAVMKTYGFPGAPAGKYKILVSKMIEDDIVYGTDEYGGRAVVSSNKYQMVNSDYSKADTTPHEVEVAAKGKTQTTIDTGEPVRVRMRGND